MAHDVHTITLINTAWTGFGETELAHFQVETEQWPCPKATWGRFHDCCRSAAQLLMITNHLLPMGGQKKKKSVCGGGQLWLLSSKDKRWALSNQLTFIPHPHPTPKYLLKRLSTFCSPLKNSSSAATWVPSITSPLCWSFNFSFFFPVTRNIERVWFYDNLILERSTEHLVK